MSEKDSSDVNADLPGEGGEPEASEIGDGGAAESEIPTIPDGPRPTPNFARRDAGAR